jgi:hypothetical protein
MEWSRTGTDGLDGKTNKIASDTLSHYFLQFEASVWDLFVYLFGSVRWLHFEGL